MKIFVHISVCGPYYLDVKEVKKHLAFHLPFNSHCPLARLSWILILNYHIPIVQVIGKFEFNLTLIVIKRSSLVIAL